MKAEFAKTISLTDARAVRVAARAPRWAVPLVKTLLVLTDIALLSLTFFLAFYLRHYQPIVQRAGGGTLGWSTEFAPYAVLLPFIIPIRLLLLRYRSEERRVGKEC